jgi:glycerol-3-phosphate acyltransferase PlsY
MLMMFLVCLWGKQWLIGFVTAFAVLLTHCCPEFSGFNGSCENDGQLLSFHTVE